MKYERGQTVAYDGSGHREYGVVVHSWVDEGGAHDYYVAFFDGGIPNGKPSQKPVILRYYEESLSAVEAR